MKNRTPINHPSLDSSFLKRYYLNQGNEVRELLLKALNKKGVKL
jgi:hypothetical protein